MIELYPPYKGTDTEGGFECQVIALYLAPLTGVLTAACIGEEGEGYERAWSKIRVDWRYDRKVGAWMSINDPEPARP